MWGMNVKRETQRWRSAGLGKGVSRRGGHLVLFDRKGVYQKGKTCYLCFWSSLWEGHTLAFLTLLLYLVPTLSERTFCCSLILLRCCSQQALWCIVMCFLLHVVPKWFAIVWLNGLTLKGSGNNTSSQINATAIRWFSSYTLQFSTICPWTKSLALRTVCKPIIHPFSWWSPLCNKF